MTRSAEIKSINCTSCGAGLDVLGGGRVQTHYCGYCGAELDAQDNYKTLAQHRDLHRPDSPFTIGQIGVIKGVEFRIIGTAQHLERYRGRNYIWIDHQLYSPTHGYAVLTVEDGHFQFSRKYRKSCRPSWVSPHRVETSERPPVLRTGGRKYRYFETSEYEITFAEGAFNWSPRIGQTFTTVSLMNPDGMISMTRSDRERETEFTEYLDHDATLAAFGCAPKPHPRNIHPLQPFKHGKDDRFMRGATAVFASICLVLTLFFIGNRGDIALERQQIPVSSLPWEFPVEITYPDKLARVTISGNLDNSWAYFDVALSDPNGALLFTAGREIGYYTGRDAEGSWSEGRRDTRLVFRPQVAGTYLLEIDVPEAGIEPGGRNISTVTVQARNGLNTGFWTFMLMLVFGAVGIFYFGRPMLHRKRRWKNSDWTDD